MTFNIIISKNMKNNEPAKIANFMF